MADQVTVHATLQADAGDFEIYESTDVGTQGTIIGGERTRGEIETGVTVPINDLTVRITLKSLGEYDACTAITKYQTLPLADMWISSTNHPITSVHIYDETPAHDYYLNSNLPDTADDHHYSHFELTSDYLVNGNHNIKAIVGTQNNSGGLWSWRTIMTGTNNVQRAVDSIDIANGNPGNNLQVEFTDNIRVKSNWTDTNAYLLIETYPLLHVYLYNASDDDLDVEHVDVNGIQAIGWVYSHENGNGYAPLWPTTPDVTVYFNPSSYEYISLGEYGTRYAINNASSYTFYSIAGLSPNDPCRIYIWHTAS